MAITTQRPAASRRLGRIALALVVVALAVWAVLVVVSVRGLAGETTAVVPTRDARLAADASVVLADVEEEVALAPSVLMAEAEPRDVPVVGQGALAASLPQTAGGFRTSGFGPLPVEHGGEGYRATFTDDDGRSVDVEVVAWPSAALAGSAAEDQVRGLLTTDGAREGQPADGAAPEAQAVVVGRTTTLVWTSFTTTVSVAGPGRDVAELSRAFTLTGGAATGR